MGNAQTKNRRMTNETGPAHVQRSEKQSKSRQWLQEGVWNQSGSPRPLLFIIVRGSVQVVPHSLSMGSTIYVDD